MSQTVRNDGLPVMPDSDTRIVPPGQQPTPLPNEYPFLRPPVGAGEIGRLGGYRIFKLLGSGGMGKVFLAEDLALKRDVALKVMCLPPGEDVLAWRERFLREARALAAIKHPNLVTVFQAGDDRGTIYLAMELLEGETLEARVRRAAPVPVPEVLRIAEQVATGLAAVHERGLIHRDIKPGNIWLSAPSQETQPMEAGAPPAGVVKILDFGLVREIKGDTQLTEAGMVMGTPAFMSPEQVRGKLLDARTDLFSFGCVLYAMCTGRSPFDADNPMAQAAALAADEPVRARKLNPEIPKPLSKLIAELLAKDPNDRPNSAAEVIERLRAVASGDEEPATEEQAAGEREAEEREDEPEPARPPFVRRHAIKLVAAIWLVVAALVVVAIVARKPNKEPDTTGQPEVVYLSDLTATGRVEWPWGTAERPYPPGADGSVTVRGKRAAHGIFMHPARPDHPPASATFALGKGYSRFAAGVALNDGGAASPSPVRFAVYGDGVRLWQSNDVTRQSADPTCDVDVRGVTELKIEVTCWEPRGAHAVWIDPRLTK